MREKKHMKTAYRLRECLEEHDMKATELADRLGLNRSAITHYTTGTSCPKNDTAQKMADIFKVNPLWLMELSDEKYIEGVDFTVTEDEKLIIESYRKSDYETKKMVKRLLMYAEKLYPTPQK